MVMWQDLNGGRCSMGDACSNPPTADGVYSMLLKNFERHFTTNRYEKPRFFFNGNLPGILVKFYPFFFFPPPLRAPFGLYYHAAWFTHEHHKEGFIAFLDTIVNMPEVWLVTNWQAIEWVRDPQPLSTVKNFPPFQCNVVSRFWKRCSTIKAINIHSKRGRWGGWWGRKKRNGIT